MTILPGTSPPPRAVSLRLAGFARDPAAIAADRPGLAISVWRKGDLNRAGRPITRSRWQVEHRFDSLQMWDEALDGLFASLGGEEAVARLLAEVGADDQHAHFQLPVRNSPLQENNHLPLRSLALLARLGLEVGFDFSDFDAADPTHRAPGDGAWTTRRVRTA